MFDSNIYFYQNILVSGQQIFLHYLW